MGWQGNSSLHPGAQGPSLALSIPVERKGLVVEVLFSHLLNQQKLGDKEKGKSDSWGGKQKKNQALDFRVDEGRVQYLCAKGLPSFT